MDSIYWDMFPDADDAESSEDEDLTESWCTLDLEVPCAKCKHKNRLCKRCRRRQQQLQLRHSAPGAGKSSLELACFPDRAASSSSSSGFVATPPEFPDPIPEVVLQPLQGDDYPDQAQESGVAAPASPVYASMYTASPSWMSAYTPSTSTGAHERRRTEDEFLDARTGWRRRPHPTRWSQSSSAGSGTRNPERWQIPGWDEEEMAGGTYWRINGARWEEQQVVTLTPRYPSRPPVWKGGLRRRVRPVKRRPGARFNYTRVKERSRFRPLLDPLSPRYMHDVVKVCMSPSRLWAMPYVSGDGHKRAVFAMAYARGTGYLRGLWCLPAPCSWGIGDVLGVLWREGIWKFLLRWIHDALGINVGVVNELDLVD